MKRSTLILILSVSVVVFVAIFFGTSFRPLPDADNALLREASRGQQAASVDTEPNASSAGGPHRSKDEPQIPPATESPQRTDIDDEAETREWVREETTREIQKDYALLLEHLGLTASENAALLAFLIEDAIARTRTRYSDGIGMDEHERSARIAEIIGDAKIQQFLALEHNLGEYREVQYVQSALQEKGAPLTDTQQDRLLKIMIDTREQVDMTRPAHIEPRTMEYLEYTLTQLDEYDRLVVELASSVLSAKQLEHMFERNQNHSYQRANTLEMYKQRRADNPDDDLPLGYPAKRD